MKTISFLSDAIKGYVKYRKASGRDSHSYVKNVILFDHFCKREYPGQTELSQEIVDRWCKQRPHEQTWNDENCRAESAKVCAKDLYAASVYTRGIKTLLQRLRQYKAKTWHACSYSTHDTAGVLPLIIQLWDEDNRSHLVGAQ